MRNLSLVLMLGLVGITQTACTPPEAAFQGGSSADNGACIADNNGQCLPVATQSEFGPSQAQYDQLNGNIKKQQAAVAGELGNLKDPADVGNPITPINPYAIPVTGEAPQSVVTDPVPTPQPSPGGQAVVWNAEQPSPGAGKTYALGGAQIAR